MKVVRAITLTSVLLCFSSMVLIGSCAQEGTKPLPAVTKTRTSEVLLTLDLFARLAPAESLVLSPTKDHSYRIPARADLGKVVLRAPNGDEVRMDLWLESTGRRGQLDQPFRITTTGDTLADLTEYVSHKNEKQLNDCYSYECETITGTIWEQVWVYSPVTGWRYEWVGTTISETSCETVYFDCEPDPEP